MRACLDGLDDGDRLDCARGAQQVPNHALRRVDAQLRPRDGGANGPAAMHLQARPPVMQSRTRSPP